MSEKKEQASCGGPATRMVARGPVRRLFLCADCPYEGSGRVLPYATETEPGKRVEGVYSGPIRRCGDEIGA